LLSTWYQSNICHYYTFFMSDMFGSYIPNFMTTFLIPPATINCMITFPNHCPAIAYGTCSQSTTPSPKGPIPTRTNTLESRNPDTIPEVITRLTNGSLYLVYISVSVVSDIAKLSIDANTTHNSSPNE